MKERLVVELVLFSSACGADAPNMSVVETSIDTIESVVHVRNTGTPPEWTMERVLRVGSSEGDADAFGRIRSIIADSDGRVYIADNLANEIRVFAPDGQHLRTIGRRGAGPGEFGDLYSLAWLGDRLAALDPLNARIGLLSTEGNWLDGIRHYPISGPPTLIRLHPLGTSGFYAPIVSGGSGGLPFVRYTDAGPADTIRIPPRPQHAKPTGVTCHRPDGGITGIAVPETPALAYAFPPSGSVIAFSWTEDYRVALLNHRGDTLRVISRDVIPAPYSDSTWERATAPYRDLMASFPGTRCDPQAPQRPATRAALRQLLFDESGRMWIEAAVESGFVWELFDPEGRLVGRAHAPPASPSVPPYVRDDHLYQVETDSLGVQ